MSRKPKSGIVMRTFTREGKKALKKWRIYVNLLDIPEIKWFVSPIFVEKKRILPDGVEYN